MSNSMAVFTFFAFEHHFFGNMVLNVRIISLNWNLVPRLIQICRVQRWSSLYCFQWKIPFLHKFGPKSQNCQFKLKFRRYLVLRLKFSSAKGASFHPAFIGNCPTISHMFWPYMTSRWVLLFVLMLLKKMRTLGESEVSGVNQGNEGGRWVEYFLVLPQGCGNFRSVFSRVRLHI